MTQKEKLRQLHIGVLNVLDYESEEGEDAEGLAGLPTEYSNDETGDNAFCAEDICDYSDLSEEDARCLLESFTPELFRRLYADMEPPYYVASPADSPQWCKKIAAALGA